MRRVGLFCLLSVLFSAAPVFGQAAATGRVMGTVTEAATQRPLAGVNIRVQGTNVGTLTDTNGRFVITNVPAGTQTVRASQIGYSMQEQSVTVVAGQAATANFELQAAAVELEGIVAVGYGVQRARDVTGSVVSVQPQELQQIPTPSVGEALKGRVPGLDVRTTGHQPGSEPRIRVRGVRSLVANNDPLVVVDGVAISGGIGDISPSSIQSIEVLKDASAAAVYGSRGANGVILITTNRGQAGSTRIAYDTRVGVQQIHNQIQIYDGAGFAQFRRDAARSNNAYPCPVGQICPDADALIFTVEEMQGLQNGVSTDYFDLISRNGLLQEHNLSISGGTENTRFAIGGNYLDEQGVTLGMGFVRRGATASIDHTAGRFNSGLSVNVSNSLQERSRGDALWGEAMQNSPLGNPYLEDGSLNPLPTTDPQRWNPLLDIENWKRDTQRTRTFGSAFASFELMQGISLQTSLGADLLFRREGEFVGALTQANRGSNNRTWVERHQLFNYTSTTQLNIDRQLADAHRVNATLVYEIQNERTERSRADVQNLPYEYQRYHNIGSAGQVTGVSSNFSEWGLQSGMARANYILLDRYYLTLIGRQDCSSRLAPGNKCSFFPSIATRWRISDEAFMRGQALFSDLSVRGSVGRLGNSAINPYQTQGSLTRTPYSFQGQSAFGFRPNEIANPNLKWETTTQFDVGLEFGVLNNRITGVIDGYVSNTTDLLMQRQLPATTGFNSVLENVGETRNRGFEVALSTINLDGWRGIRWTSDVNFSVNRNEIVSLYGGQDDDVGNNWFIGQPIRIWYDYEFGGIWQLDEAEEAARYSRRPGDVKVVDQNGDGRVSTDGDRVILGRHPEFPAWTGSLSNRFDFGAFDVSSLITARWGYTIRSNIWPGQMSARYNQPAMDYWTPENPSNRWPRPYRNSENTIDASALQFFDGSHWRVRNVTLGYAVPARYAGRLTENSSLRVYLQAQDPLVFTSFPGLDPEGTTNNDAAATNLNYGQDQIGVPSFRTFVVGASVSF
jgi:TonB-linked SusC/RagA family outer membrane protein